MKRLLLTLLAIFSSSGVLFADATLDAIAEKLTEKYHLFGQSLEPSDIPGRVVVIWDLTSKVNSNLSLSDSNRNDNYNNRNDNDEEKNKEDELRTQANAIMKAGKKSKALLVIGVLKVADNTVERKKQIVTLRKLRPRFPVYAIEAGTALYDAKGECKISTGNISDIADGDRLANTLAETPEYVPGRIILFKTEVSESTSKRFVAGKNLESMFAALQRTAQGSDARATDAQRMIEAINTYIENECAAIDSALEQRPSQAINRIAKFCATFPSRGQKYQRMLGMLRNSREVKTCLAASAFLNAANRGDIGTGDMGRKADGLVKTLTQLSQSKNQAVAAESAHLLSLITPYTSAELEKVRQEQLTRDREAKEEEEEQDEKNRKSNRGNRRNNKEDDGPSIKNDTDAFSYLISASPSGSFEVFKDELSALKHSTCNYDVLIVSYGKYEKTKGDKTEAAKVLIDTITGMRNALMEQVNNVQKAPLDVLLTEDAAKTIDDAVIPFDYETLLTVNFPSLANTPPGRNVLKMYRDAEVKRIADAITDYRSDKDDGEYKEGETAADRKVKKHQTKIAKLKMIQKYRRTKTPLGKLCVAQMDQMGFTDEGIEGYIKDEQENVKAAKQEAKEEEERQKENNRRNR